MFTLGRFLSLSTFGESHGKAYGGILSNFPSGISLDLDLIQQELDRRRPGQSNLVTQRKEKDEVEFLSGLYEGKTTGTPLGFIVHNTDQKSKDYGHLADSFRPSHADRTYEDKFGLRDPRGGGRSSARETLNWVIAGAIARQLLPEVQFSAFVSSVSDISLNSPLEEIDLSKIEDSPVRCPDPEVSEQMIAKIKETKKQGDTLGGTITCVIKNVPKNLGEPVFGKFQAELAHAMLSIPAAKGFEYGSGFSGTLMKGSEHNDLFNPDFSTKTNYSGGIQGGITNGMDLYFRVAFKPVATLLRPQPSFDRNSNPITLEGKGRHDACVVPRAVPIVENLAAYILADLYLINQSRLM